MWKYVIVSLALLSQIAAAQTKEEANNLSKRYADDRKLCAEESSSSARMQCLRDAKTEYDKGLAALKTAPAPSKNGLCNDCAKVLSVKQIEREGKGSALGVVAGGVAGALLGNQVGGGRGRDVATIAGAAGGAYAGNEIEKNMKKEKIWQVQVEYKDGQKQVFEFKNDPAMKAGDTVKKQGNSIAKQ
jgi:uncharacterized protein YcfJ